MEKGNQLMKKTLYLTLTLLTFGTLVFSRHSFAQVGSPEYDVRVIYFLPSDRPPQPDINEKLDKLIKDTQLFYAEQMTAHGFGTKTFEFEADTAGRVVVHHLTGQFNDAYYHSNAWHKVWQEIEGQFDLSKNIWLTALDTRTERINHRWCGQGGGGSLDGRALMPASGVCFNVTLTAHELGHAFGLMHDNRIKGRWVYTRPWVDRMITSFCSAEWLDVHRYFQINHTLSTEVLASNATFPFSSAAIPEMLQLCGVEALDSHERFRINQIVPNDAPPTFEMLSPPTFAGAPNAIHLRFRVTDADGIHQVRLHTPEWDPYVAGEFIACKHLNERSATVEFVTTELSPRSESVHLWMIDKKGSFYSNWFDPYPINITTMLPPATTVSIPDPQLAAAVRQKIGNITTLSLLNLRELNAQNYTGIADLTGLEYAYNLKFIRNVLDGKITNLRPLANLTGLTYLDLREHQIRDISPLGNLTNLDTLLLWNNQISDITALRGLTNLTWLAVDNNQINDIAALQNLTNLGGLGLGGNQISDITALRGLTNLKQLWLWYNQIRSVHPLVGLVNLEELYIAGNPIEDMSPLQTLLANNPNLKIDIDVPRPPPTSLALRPNTIADQTFVVNRSIAPVVLPEATGGTAPYTYTLSPIPNGLVFDASTRTLTGTPTTPAPATSVTYTATDATNASVSLTFTIEVRASLALRPNTVTDQTFVVNKSITSLVLPQATGGTAPYTYTLSPIPNGLVFDTSTRTLSGTPTRVAPATSVTYTATDAMGASASLTFTIIVEANLDVNRDGKVDVLDLVWVAVSYQMRGDGLRTDVNADGVVNVQDLGAVAEGIDATVVLPANVAEEVALAAEAAAAFEGVAEAPVMGVNRRSEVVSGLTAHRNVAAALADAKALVTGDVRLGKSLPLLEGLLQVLAEMRAIPETTALLPNYPNPFNPETWFPYQLATPASVTLSIYSVEGHLVRTLDIGHQPVGVYRSKHRTAYWDGKNQYGEKVASGLYFYTLTAGDFTATRKLLIAK